MRKLALALVLALSACSIPDFGSVPRLPVDAVAYVLHGDTRFTREERWIFEIASENWNAFSDGRVMITIAWDLDELSLVRLKDQPRLVRVSPYDARTRAVEASNRGLVIAFEHHGDRRLPTVIGIVADRVPELYPVAVHELGHAAGIGDLPCGVDAVMSKCGAAWKFTRADWEHCRAERVCGGRARP